MSTPTRSSPMSLTQPIARTNRSPRVVTPLNPSARTPGGTLAPAHTQYVSFPTPQQMHEQRIASNGSVSPVDESLSALPPKTSLAPTDRRSLAWSLFTFIISSPALLGMCCWPSLLAGIIGGSVTGSARVMSHTISFIVTLAVLILMLSYTAYCTKARAQLHSKHFSIYGPLYLLSFASLLVIADPFRHILQNAGVWNGPSSNAFKEGCGEGWNCLTTTGILFTGLFTYLGFSLMFIASMWNGNLLQKCRLCGARMAEIRAAHAARELELANSAREEAIRAAEEEAERIRQEAALLVRQRAIAASVSAREPNFSFQRMHLSMAPPPCLYEESHGNKHSRIGQRTDSSTPSSTNGSARREMAAAEASRSASSTRSVDHSPEGYSFEVRSPDVTESVIAVGARKLHASSHSPDMKSHQPHHPAALSPTVTHSPSSQSRSGHSPPFGASPLSSTRSFSDVALTPAAGMGSSTNAKRSPIQQDRTPQMSAVLESPRAVPV